MTRPINPYLVLLLAIALPGAGHVLIGDQRRGLALPSSCCCLAR